MAREKALAVGVDLGGTKLEAALVDAEGRVYGRRRLPTDVSGGPEAVRAQIMWMVKELGAEAGTLWNVAGVGLGVAGQIDARTGTVLFGPNLGWKDAPLGKWLKQDLALPITVTNDVRAATFAEWRFGAGRGVRDLVCLFIGTGIGGGIVAGGRLLCGQSNSAGELGHIIVELHGPPCGCGGRGCLEAIAGGRALARQARRAVKAYPAAGARMLSLAGDSLDGVTAEIVVRAAQLGCRLAGDILSRAKEALLAGLVSIVHAFNPGRIILGGGVLEGMPELVEELEQGVRGRAMEAATRGLKVVRAELGALAGAIGAAAMVFESEA